MRSKRYDVFLAGPIAGVEDYRERFDRMERDVLRFHGSKLRVWNPARLPGGRSNRWYMARCLIALWQSRRVVALRGWENSGGAMIEVALAKYIGIPVEKVKSENEK
ncbi:MAG: DUF4406 domain-containing protein [Lentisphaerae bacterium]|nr:DUF4406 domain-containing protein [Lentisphaerota bacterium]